VKTPHVYAGFLALAVSAMSGDISGHIVISKQISKKPVSAAVYSLRGVAPPEASKSETAAANEYERVVLWLEGGNLPPKAPVAATMNQRGIDFSPDLLIVPVGSTVDFPNSDPIFHNVFSLSKTQTFDLGFYPRGQSRSVKFNRPGVVQLYCHLHSKMYAVIVVTSSPWYAKGSADGTFSFSSVPEGHYRLFGWHKVAGLYQTDVVVNPHGVTEATIRIPVDVEPPK